MVEAKIIRLGVAPTRRDSWASEKAFEHADRIMAWLREKSEELCYEIIDMETLNFQDKEIVFGKDIKKMKADSLLTDYADACIAADYFKKKDIDALFIPFCDFGQEEAVAKLGKELKVPLLIWGPRDEAPNKMEWRPTDTQCGMFAASKVLQRYDVKFTYIENCRLEDKVFEIGFKQFLCTAAIVKEVRHARILQISVRPQQFLGVMVNEGELLERFGIEVVPITTSELFAEIDKEREKQDLESFCEDLQKKVDLSALKEKKYTMAAIENGIFRLAKKYQCNAAACECWHEIITQYDISPCFVLGNLNDRGLPCACEMDIHGAVSSLMAAAAKRFSEPSFFADLTLRHPTDDNIELLWHCGPFAKSLIDRDTKGYVTESGQGFYPLKKGEVTVIRFDGSKGRYKCLTGIGESVDGPVTNGNYVWLKVDDWIKWEKKIIYGPYIHHVSGIFGDYREEIKDACRYLGIEYDTPLKEENN